MERAVVSAAQGRGHTEKVESSRAWRSVRYWGRVERPLGAMLGRVYTELLFSQTKKMVKDHTWVHREKGWAEDGDK